MSANEATGPSTNTEKIWYHPSTEIAREVQRSSRIRMIKDGKKKKFHILPVYLEDTKTDSDELLWGKLGDGMTLYFDFLKLMCWVFAAMTLLATPQLVLSSMGGTYVASNGVFGLSTPPYNAPLAKLSIVNLFLNDSLWSGPDELNQMRSMTIGGDVYSLTPRKVGLVLTLLDITGVIIFLVALAKFEQKINKKADRVGSKAFNIQQYSIVVKGLPRHAKEDAIRKFFSCYGPIADIKIASYSAHFLTYLQEKSGIEEELVDLLSSGFKEIQQERDNALDDGCCSKRKPGETYDIGEHIPKIAIANDTIYTRRAKHIPMLRRMGELERQLQKFSNSQEDDKTDCYACFITFEKIADRNSCLKTYDESLIARVTRGIRTSEEIEKISFQYDASEEELTKKTCSKQITTGPVFALPRVYPATAPTNILWQNLEYHKGSRRIRKTVVGFCTFIMILVSFACIYATSVYSSTLNDPSCDKQIKKPPCGLFLSGSGCNNSFTKDMDQPSRSLCYASMMNSFSNSTDDSCKACWCVEALNSISDILRDDLIVKKEYNKACEQPIISFFVRRSLLQGSVAFIVVINVILKAGLAFLVPLEKHHTRTQSDQSLVHKVFVSQFINTALVTLLVNTRFSGFAERFSSSGAKFPLFTGPYDDFTLPWYIDIGSNHVVTMISNAIQTFIPIVILWPLQIIQETWATRNTATQIILNRQLKGAVFEVAARLGVLLSTVYACMFYSANMPFLNIILFLTFLFSYWVDRIFLLRVCRTPPAYDSGLVKFAVKTLRWAVIGHVLVGMWSFSALMPLEPVSDAISTYVQNLLGESLDPDVQRLNFIARLFSWVAFPFVLFLIFYILSTIGLRVIWDKIFRPIFLRCFKTSKFLQPTIVEVIRDNQPDFTAALKDDNWVGPTSYSVAHMDDYVQAFADHAQMLAQRESKKSDITRADVRRMIFEKTMNLQKDYIKQRIGEVLADQTTHLPPAGNVEVELPELNRQYESDKSSVSSAAVLTRPSSSIGGPTGTQSVQMAQVTQAALLKRRTGQDELRSTPDSDSVGGDDAGSMYSSASGVGIIPAAMAAVPDSDQESFSTTPYGTRSSAAPQ